MSTANAVDQRAHDRFRLEPMYTSLTVHRIHRMAMRRLEGHAYDVSEGGARFELDEPLVCGERVSVCLRLPGASTDVSVSGSVVWVRDEADDPGPRRMAIRFTDFPSEDDRRRLIRHLGSGLCRRCA